MKPTISPKAAHRWCMVTCCILMLSHTGCSALTTAKNSPGKKNATWSPFKKKEYQTPQSINVTWTYDIFTKEGKPPTRGFGGRLYFYNEKSQAIPVEGELTVYGFDDTQRNHDGSSIESADKKFRFTPEQFTTHFSESELGASYSIWIPWDAAPGMQKKIMLIPTFKTKDGPVIRGNAATVLLPGEVPVGSQQPVLQASVQGGVQRASYAPASSPLTQPRTSHDPIHRTTTIQLPSRGYPSRPVLSPEQREAMLKQIQSAQPEVTPLQTPISHIEDQAVNSVSHTTNPASQVAESVPGFHIAIGNQPGALQKPPLVNGSSLPGFAQASVGIRPAHSEPNPPQARAGSTVPSSVYPPR
jgi:hypothetical protein